jgi:hypothetical protein
MATTNQDRRLVYVKAEDLEQWNCRPIGATPVMDLKDHTVGRIDGLMIESPAEQPRFLVIFRDDSKSRERFLVPVNDAWFDETQRAVRIDVTLRRSALQQFDLDRFERMSGAEAAEFERRILKQCCPEVPIKTDTTPDYPASKSFKCPAWVR